MEFPFINLHGYGPLLLSGIGTTLSLALVGFAVALLIGGLGCWGRLSSVTAIKGAIGFYTGVIRGIPDLVMIFLVYYGGQTIVNAIAEYFGKEGLQINPFWAGVASLGLYNGSFLVEVFRAAYLSLPKGQLEAARTLGLSQFTIFIRIIIPQMVMAALSGVNNVWQILMKSTALVSVIGLADLVGYADKAGKAIRQPFVFFLAVVVFYLVVTGLSTIFFKYLEQRTLKYRSRSAKTQKRFL